MNTDRPEPLPTRVAAALDRIARARRVRRQAVATRHGLTPLQVELLTTLAGGPPPPPQVGLLAAEVGVAQPTATDSVRALERKGLVGRGGGRRPALALTAAGRLLAEDLALADQDLVRAVEALPAAAQAATLEALLTLISRLVETGAVTVARTCLTCRFHEHDGAVHRCTLLGADLPPADLRVNCPEHELAPAA